MGQTPCGLLSSRSVLTASGLHWSFIWVTDLHGLGWLVESNLFRSYVFRRHEAAPRRAAVEHITFISEVLTDKTPYDKTPGRLESHRSPAVRGASHDEILIPKYLAADGQGTASLAE